MTQVARPSSPRIFLALLLVLTGVAFVPTLDAPFVLDDHWRLVANDGVATFWPPWRHFVDPSTSASIETLVQFRPLLPLSFSVDRALWGVNAVASRAVNVLLHGIAVLLTFGFVRELLAHWSRVPMTSRSIDRSACVIAALVAIHPIAAYTVNYISARDIVLAQVGMLVVLWTYARHRRQRPPRWSRAWVTQWLAMLVPFGAAMLSKQNVVVVPALLIAFELLAVGSSLRTPAIWLRALPFVAIVAGWSAWANVVLGFNDLQTIVGVYPRAAFAFTQAKLHGTEYIASLLWPFRLRYLPFVSLEATLWNLRSLAGVGTLLLSAWVGWRLRARSPLIGLGIASYWILMSLESSFLPVANLMAPYRQYPALVFVALSAVLLVRQALHSSTIRWARPVIAGSAIGAALCVTWFNSAHWRSEERFWAHAVQYGGDHRAHTNAAASIADASDPRVRYHIAEASRLGVIHATRFLAVRGAGRNADQVGVTFRADTSAVLDTSIGRIHFWRAHALRESGKTAEARAEADRAADAAPMVASYQWYAAMDAQSAEDWSRVVVLAQRMEALDTDPSSVAFLGGAALQNLGRNQEAIDWYLRYLSLPAEESSLDGRRMVTMNLAIAATAIGRCELARPQLLARQREQPTEAAITGLLAACPER
jgi:hypothetical protein